ncbi:MAG: hypothetical protein OJF49_001246 [Ktedonobacterales bacterium]|nr:MAG: hypothetical protein OJF49_001246 [Ktedonobacterales bacterium]
MRARTFGNPLGVCASMPLKPSFPLFAFAPCAAMCSLLLSPPVGMLTRFSGLGSD